MKYQRVTADELFAAMRLGSSSIVRQLVRRDALVARSRDEAGLSAILRCLYDWNLELMEILLAASPELDIFEAAALGKVERLEQLLARTPELAHAWSADGVTPLHLACFYGQEEAVECLLEAGADASVGAQNQPGSTPLHEATRSGQRNIVLLLLARGADTELSDRQGWTPLHLAASQGYQDIVEVLLLCGTHSHLTGEGKSPRDLAVANGHMGTARVLESLAKS